MLVGGWRLTRPHLPQTCHGGPVLQETVALARVDGDPLPAWRQDRSEVPALYSLGAQDDRRRHGLLDGEGFHGEVEVWLVAGRCEIDNRSKFRRFPTPQFPPAPHPPGHGQGASRPGLRQQSSICGRGGKAPGPLPLVGRAWGTTRERPGFRCCSRIHTTALLPLAHPAPRPPRGFVDCVGSHPVVMLWLHCAALAKAFPRTLLPPCSLSGSVHGHAKHTLLTAVALFPTHPNTPLSLYPA